jgi:hypothetical protein
VHRERVLRREWAQERLVRELRRRTGAGPLTGSEYGECMIVQKTREYA